MSTSSSYYSSLGDMYESIEEPQDERWTRQAARQTFNQNRMPMPAHSSAEYYMIPRPRPPSRASAQHQAYPPNTGHHIQPAVRGTVPQIPVHYQQDVISDLPSRNMPGEWITQSPPSRVVNQNSMPAHSSPEYYMIPRHRLPGQASAQHQAYFPNTGSHIQPAVSGTVSQIPVHYRQDVISDLPSRNVPGSSRHANNQESEDHHVAQIVREMEKDVNLMEDNPLSEQLRVEALRGMPESLTLKRTVKRNLTQSVSRKSKRTPLSTWKMLKYRLSTYLRNFSVAVRNLLYTLELWYSSLKTIEGHFGSGVASYFRFLRWLFLLNIAVFLISFGFVVIPQLLHHSYQPVEENQPYNLTYSHVDGFFHLLEESNSTTYLRKQHKTLRTVVMSQRATVAVTGLWHVITVHTDR